MDKYLLLLVSYLPKVAHSWNHWRFCMRSRVRIVTTNIDNWCLHILVIRWHEIPTGPGPTLQSVLSIFTSLSAIVNMSLKMWTSMRIWHAYLWLFVEVSLCLMLMAFPLLLQKVVKFSIIFKKTGATNVIWCVMISCSVMIQY